MDPKPRKTELMISYSRYHQSSWESHLFIPLLLESQHLVLKISFILYNSLFFVGCFFRLSPGVLFLYYFHFKVLWKFEADIWIMDDGEQPNFSLPTKLQRNERRRWGTGKWKWKWKEMRNRGWKWRTIKINLTTKMFIKRRAGEKKGNQILSRDCVNLKKY